MRVAVIGAGVMGLATAAELARNGARVTVFERDVVGNELASSVDRSKVFRFAYPDPFYADLGRRSLALWRDLEGNAGEPLLEQCGVLYLDAGGDVARAVDEALAAIGAEHELMDAPSLRRRWPQLTPPEEMLGAWDPAGGFLRADRCVSAVARLARARGAEIRERAPVASPRDLEADEVVIAAGPWSRGLLGDLPLRTTMQWTVSARPRDAAPYAADRFPVFIEERSGFYGVPVHADGALKLALHKRGGEHAPLRAQEEAPAAFVEACRAFWRSLIPGLADAPLLRSRACVYNDTPDEDFLIGRHRSGVFVCTGFSGHGFKFAPLIGRISAQLVLGQTPDVDCSRFAPSRVVAA
jgi:sarcosine oxidase